MYNYINIVIIIPEVKNTLVVCYLLKMNFAEAYYAK